MSTKLMSSILGQHHWRRALEVALVGDHSLLLVGKPVDVDDLIIASRDAGLSNVSGAERVTDEHYNEYDMMVAIPPLHPRDSKPTYCEPDTAVRDRVAVGRAYRTLYVGRCERWEPLAIALSASAKKILKKGDTHRHVFPVAQSIACLSCSLFPITGADLDYELLVKAVHLAEALQYYGQQ